METNIVAGKNDMEITDHRFCSGSSEKTENDYSAIVANYHKKPLVTKKENTKNPVLQ
jgi:hypothetical protein